MSKLDSKDREDLAPSYEEAVASGADTATLPQYGLRFQSAVDATRHRRVQDICRKHINPYLFPQILDGISRLTLILIPSDHEQKAILEKDIVGIPSLTTVIHVIRLKDEEYKSRFCLQMPVVRAFEDSLEASLKDFISPPSDIDRSTPQGTANILSEHSLPAVGTDSRRWSSWLRKKGGVSGEEHDPTRSTRHLNGGWRADDEHLRGKKLAPNNTTVSAKLRDVSFRTENEMGLLCTETVKAVWIDIEVGS